MTNAVATFGGGCFWCVETAFNSLRGVESAVSGYMGGAIDNPTYEQVCSGETGHAEVVQVTFDPGQIGFDDLLAVFFTVHDPTTPNRQGNDIGTQYRSEIFYFNDQQKNTALKVIAAANKSGVFKKPISTTISKASTFYPAEEYHQDYLKKNPYGYTCHHVRDEWKF